MTGGHPGPVGPVETADRAIRAKSLTMHGAIMHATMDDAANAASRGNYQHARRLLSEVRVYLETAERAVDRWKGGALCDCDEHLPATSSDRGDQILCQRCGQCWECFGGSWSKPAGK